MVFFLGGGLLLLFWGDCELLLFFGLFSIAFFLLFLIVRCNLVSSNVFGRRLSIILLATQLQYRLKLSALTFIRTPSGLIIPSLVIVGKARPEPNVFVRMLPSLAHILHFASTSCYVNAIFWLKLISFPSWSRTGILLVWYPQAHITRSASFMCSAYSATVLAFINLTRFSFPRLTFLNKRFASPLSPEYEYTKPFLLVKTFSLNC